MLKSNIVRFGINGKFRNLNLWIPVKVKADDAMLVRDDGSHDESENMTMERKVIL